jgi:thiamine monophosphate synthase
MSSGAGRVAVVRAVFASKNPELAAQKLKLQLEGKGHV